MSEWTLGEWLTEWFEIYKKPTLQPTSIRNIEQMIRLHIPATLKKLSLSELTPFEVEKALMRLGNTRTGVYARQVLFSALSKAARLGFVERNVMENVDKIRYKKVKGKALTVAEQQAFLQALDKSRYKWLMLFYLHTGVRRSEGLALQWSDIDFTGRLILIRGTKTEESFRYIPMTKEVELILQEQRRQNVKYCPAGNLVFPFNKEQTSKAFKKLCPNHHLHDLRHTFITRCAECGVNINVCQQLVGHSTADMTLNVYTHVMDEFKRKELQKFSIFPKY